MCALGELALARNLLGVFVDVPGHCFEWGFVGRVLDGAALDLFCVQPDQLGVSLVAFAVCAAKLRLLLLLLFHFNWAMEESFTTHVKNCFVAEGDMPQSSEFEDNFNEHYVKNMKETAPKFPEHAWELLRAVAVASQVYGEKLEHKLEEIKKELGNSGPWYCAFCAKTVYKNKVVKGAELCLLDSEMIATDKRAQNCIAFFCCSTHVPLVKNMYGLTHACMDLRELIQKHKDCTWEKAVSPKNASLLISQWKKPRSGPPLTVFEQEMITYWNCIKLWTTATADAASAAAGSLADEEEDK